LLSAGFFVLDWPGDVCAFVGITAKQMSAVEARVAIEVGFIFIVFACVVGVVLWV
jgi:hypothetical protein